MPHYTRMKHIATDLAICSEETGYNYDFLCKVVNDDLADGLSYDEAVYYTLRTAYEHDF